MDCINLSVYLSYIYLHLLWTKNTDECLHISSYLRQQGTRETYDCTLLWRSVCFSSKCFKTVPADRKKQRSAISASLPSSPPPRFSSPHSKIVLFYEAFFNERPHHKHLGFVFPVPSLSNLFLPSFLNPSSLCVTFCILFKWGDDSDD